MHRRVHRIGDWLRLTMLSAFGCDGDEPGVDVRGEFTSCTLADNARKMTVFGHDQGAASTAPSRLAGPYRVSLSDRNDDQLRKPQKHSVPALAPTLVDTYS
jgi:hypothetical protein